MLTCWQSIVNERVILLCYDAEIITFSEVVMEQLDSTPSPISVEKEIDRATEFAQSLEDLVVSKGSVTTGQASDRDKLLLAHWSLVLEYNKSILGGGSEVAEGLKARVPCPRRIEGGAFV